MKTRNGKKIELLAPGGNLEKLKYAIEYGADAVYVGLPDFSLRVRINNFSPETLKEAVDYAKKKKKKIYLTLNIYAHNRHLKKLEKHLKFLKKMKIDGVIVSDPGIIRLVKKYLPKTEIHLSTQANATNWQAVKFWSEQGVKRVVLAREVTLSEIKEIKKNVPEMELEYFIHGAMCMSYSGRCILSKWMTGRSANLGDCSQPCRWRYRQDKSSKFKDKSEERNILESRVADDMGKFIIDLEEDLHGTYFFNSHDLNLLKYIDKLVEAGINSLKIEGRAKSIYYVAVVVRAYRKVLDALDKKLSKQKIGNIAGEQKAELDKLENRGYTAGFLLGGEPAHNVTGKKSKNVLKFVGEVEGVHSVKSPQSGVSGAKFNRAKGKFNIVRVHNEIFKKDELEAVSPEKTIPVRIKKIYNYKMEEMQEAHGGHEKRYFMLFDKILEEKTLLRKIA